jgi:hypothetical protein
MIGVGLLIAVARSPATAPAEAAATAPQMSAGLRAYPVRDFVSVEN